MSKLSQVRCINHIDREAVSICKHCHNYFCRECITDYDDKMLCKSCIDKLISQNRLNKKKKKKIKAISCCYLFLYFAVVYFLFFRKYSYLNIRYIKL